MQQRLLALERAVTDHRIRLEQLESANQDLRGENERLGEKLDGVVRIIYTAR